jgi:hypothetical protein
VQAVAVLAGVLMSCLRLFGFHDDSSITEKTGLSRKIVLLFFS